MENKLTKKRFIQTSAIQQINEAYERMIKGEVKYRFVINMASLQNT